MLESLCNQPAEHPSREAFRGAVDGYDALQVEGVSFIVFENLELGLFEDDLFAPAFGFAIDHDAHARGDDFFDPVKVVPAQKELAGKSIGVVFDQADLKGAESATALNGSSLDESADANWDVGFVPGKPVKAGAVLPAFRKMRNEVAEGFQTKSGELAGALGSDPREFFEWGVPAHEEGAKESVLTAREARGWTTLRE
jgi:hypothetical protein